MSEPVKLAPAWVQNSIAVNISRDMALALGLVEPTPEERAEMDERNRKFEERRRESWRIYDEARPALAALTDPVARTVLDLHSPKTIDGPKCEGCDVAGYEAEQPEWPCRTVQTVAAHYGIALPEAWDLWRRPDDSSA